MTNKTGMAQKRIDCEDCMNTLWFWGGFAAAGLCGFVAGGWRGSVVGMFAYISLNALYYSWGIM
jgi:hypothetical protein